MDHGKVVGTWCSVWLVCALCCAGWLSFLAAGRQPGVQPEAAALVLESKTRDERKPRTNGSAYRIEASAGPSSDKGHTDRRRDAGDELGRGWRVGR